MEFRQVVKEDLQLDSEPMRKQFIENQVANIRVCTETNLKLRGHLPDGIN